MELTDQDLAWAQENIQKTEFFANCTAAELSSLLDSLEKQHYSANSTVLFQGEISSRLCLVESGSVAIYVRKGKEKCKVATLGANSYFGEISLLTPRAATATVKADTDCDIIFLPGEIVQALVKNNPVLAETINKKIAERLEAQKHATESPKQE